MRNSFVILLAAGFATGLGPVCAQPTPDQFAYGLDVEARKGVVRMLVPLHIEQHTTRNDLGDLRVFNARGEIVPHAVETSAAKRKIRDVRFALEPQSIEQSTSDSLRIATHAGDATVTIEKSGNPVDPARIYTLSNAGNSELPFGALSLVWKPVSESFSANIGIAVSQDLAAWRSLGDRFTVGQIRSAEGWDRLDRVTFPEMAARYLKITLNGGAKLELAEVVIEFDESEKPAANWTMYEALEYNPGKGEALYDTLGRVPIEMMDIVYDKPVVTLQATMESRRSPSQKWRGRGRKLFFRLGEDDSLPHSEVFRLHSSDRYWRITYSTREGEHPLKPPKLKVGWAARELVFFAEQDGVYRVGYGLDKLEAPAWEVGAAITSAAKSQQMQAIQDGRNPVRSPAVASPPEIVRGEQSLSMDGPVLWRKAILWAVLLAGVVALFAMTRNLMGEMAARTGRVDPGAAPESGD